MKSLKWKTLLPLLLWLLASFQVPVDGVKRENLVIKGTTVGPDFPKTRHEDFAPKCPAMTVSLNNGKLCCNDPMRSDMCPGYQSDLIQRSDPEFCCRHPKPFPCPEGVCYSEAVTIGEDCPLEYPNAIALGTRCTSMKGRSANCPTGAEGSPLVSSDPPECAIAETTVDCTKGSPRHWGRCEGRSCRAPSIVSSNGYWDRGLIDFSTSNVLIETCERDQRDKIYLTKLNEVNVGFIMHMGCGQVVKEVLMKNTKNGNVSESSTENFKIDVSLDGQNWTEIVRATLASVAFMPCETIQIEKFPATKLVNALYLRFTLLSYRGDHGGLNYLSWTQL